MSNMATVIYARQSLDKSGEAAAVARQIKECRELADRHKLTVARELVDNDVSATKGTRPAFQELLRGVRSGDIDTIVVWHTDRLYRRVRDLVELVELAEKHSLRILTVRAGDLDLNNPAGRMMAQMLGAAARYEVEAKGARQVAANAQRANAGERHFAQRPYGYERIEGKIQIVESEAQVLREAVNRVVAGESWYSIAKDFKRRGIVGISGKPFSYQNLMQRATNPAIAGIRTYLGEVVNEEGNWPPLIDRVTWDRLRNVMINRSRTQKWDTKIKYLGSRLYRCGKCGARMVVSRDYKSGGTPVYQCENLDTRRNLERVDELVETALLERLSQPDVLSLLTPSEDASALAAESQETRERINGLGELYADGILTMGAVREQKAKLQARLDELQARLNAMEGGTILNDLVSANSLESFWRDFMTIQNKRRVVDALMEVTIMPTKRGGTNQFRPEDVTIEFRS